jgi:hypothetical protein
MFSLNAIAQPTTICLKVYSWGLISREYMRPVAM